MDNQIFEHYRELKRKEKESIELLLKLGYVIGDREAINETVMLIKSRKVDFIEGVDSIVKELNQNKEYLIKRISKAFFRMNNLKPNKKAIVKYKVMVIAKTSEDDSV